MIITSILTEIFLDDEESRRLAVSYVEDIHNEIGLEWFGRQNLRIGFLLAYMRVVVGPEEACKEFNRIVSEYVSNSECDRDEPIYGEFDWPALECVSDLRWALEVNPYSEEHFIEEMIDFIANQPMTEEALHLVPVERL